MRDGTVLVRGDITFRIYDAGVEHFVPLLAHFVGVIVAGDRGPERGVGKPFVPEGRFWSRAGIMVPEKLAQRGHLLLMTGHFELWKIVRRRGAEQDRADAACAD